jgi:hypothetical protein
MRLFTLLYFMVASPPAALLALVLLSASSMAGAQPLQSSPASQPDAPSPSLQAAREGAADLKAEDLIGAQGQPIPVKIRLPDASANGTDRSAITRFLMFRGLAEGVHFSAGFKVNSSWAVAASDLPDLELLSAPDYCGAFLVQVTAHTAKGHILGRSIIPVIITPGEGENDQILHLASLDAGSAESAPSDPRLTEEDRLLRRAEELIATGLIGGARLLYARLAEEGNGRAAYALAQSFDPDSLSRMNVIGLAADRMQAQVWYGRAAQLGYGPALERVAGAGRAH